MTTDMALSARQSWLKSSFEAAARAFNEESTRWFLWLPVGLGIGAAAFLAWPETPPIWMGIAAFLPFAALWKFAPRGLARALCVIAMVIAAGFMAGQLRDMMMFHIPLARPVGPVWMQGNIVELDHKEKAVRIIMNHLEFDEGWWHGGRPQVVRVSVRGEIPPEWHAGDRINLLAKLMPLTAPVEPGGFDFAIVQYFNGLDATGFSFGKPTLLQDVPPARFSTWLESARENVRARIFAALPDQKAEAAIGSAIFTGKENEIPEANMQDLRDTGLIHLIAISGIHVAFMAALIFFIVRRSLALIPPLALHWDLKKIASVAALIGIGAYMMLCGAPLRGQRATLMAALTLIALLIDRRTISLRVLAIVAAGVILLEPEKLYSFGFHLSFAAVAGLIAGFEWSNPKLTALFANRPIARRILREPLHLIMTSAFTTLATMPFIFYNFQNTQVYGVIANIIAVPVVGVWVMPLGLLAFMLMPFGLDGFAFHWMGQGITIVLWIANLVAHLPGAVWHISALPPIAIAFFAIGFSWLCVWQKPWRWLGVPVLLLGFATAPFQPKPDLMVASGGKAMALRVNGHYVFQGSNRENFFRDNWVQWFGLRDNELDLDKDQPDFHCDDDKCLPAQGGQPIGLIRTEDGFFQACKAGARILMTIKQLKGFHGECPGVIIIRYWNAFDNGTYAFYFEHGAWRIENVNDRRGHRPWVND